MQNALRASYVIIASPPFPGSFRPPCLRLLRLHCIIIIIVLQFFSFLLFNSIHILTNSLYSELIVYSRINSLYTSASHYSSPQKKNTDCKSRMTKFHWVEFFFSEGTVLLSLGFISSNSLHEHLQPVSLFSCLFHFWRNHFPSLTCWLSLLQVLFSQRMLSFAWLYYSTASDLLQEFFEIFKTF